MSFSRLFKLPMTTSAIVGLPDPCPTVVESVVVNCEIYEFDGVMYSVMHFSINRTMINGKVVDIKQDTKCHSRKMPPCLPMMVLRILVVLVSVFFSLVGPTSLNLDRFLVFLGIILSTSPSPGRFARECRSVSRAARLCAKTGRPVSEFEGHS